MGGRPLILLFAKKENILGVLILKKKKKKSANHRCIYNQMERGSLTLLFAKKKREYFKGINFEEEEKNHYDRIVGRCIYTKQNGKRAINFIIREKREYFRGINFEEEEKNQIVSGSSLCDRQNWGRLHL